MGAEGFAGCRGRVRRGCGTHGPLPESVSRSPEAGQGGLAVRDQPRGGRQGVLGDAALELRIAGPQRCIPHAAPGLPRPPSCAAAFPAPLFGGPKRLGRVRAAGWPCGGLARHHARSRPRSAARGSAAGGPPPVHRLLGHVQEPRGQGLRARQPAARARRRGERFEQSAARRCLRDAPSSCSRGGMVSDGQQRRIVHLRLLAGVRPKDRGHRAGSESCIGGAQLPPGS
mmetsp:Transcript_114674/g.319354  ORF Transcript_114674/g.319354 Transcript_114674/m.319354 type:complete len:228 (+) Transcript_114674:377-1060(+)